MYKIIIEKKPYFYEKKKELAVIFERRSQPEDCFINN